MTTSLRTLLTDLVDYAGLFPPAKLGMQDAAEAYNRSRMSEEEWMLGRFVLPAARLEEFSKAAGALLPGTLATSGYREHAAVGEPWRLSVLLDGTDPKAVGDGLDAIDAFNEHHSHEESGLAIADNVEVKVAEAGQIDMVLDELPEEIFPFFEFPAGGDCRGFVAALAGEQAAAKIRTGGINSNAFPTAAEVVDFLAACASIGVPFKATAGLHHPVRGVYRLTYEKNPPTCHMFGFVNLFLAAALVKVKGRHDDAEALLTEEDPAAFMFMENVVKWRSYGFETAQLAIVRERFALSFGSCSFDEPVEDLTKLGWM
ncbi:MAG: hypothetical protein WC718_15660 [Phycisphaerales bacterium]|jgi:hypothetical protein